MRRPALVFLAAAACGTAERREVYIAVDSDAVGTAGAAAAPGGPTMRLLENDGDIAVLAYDREDLDALSRAMHEHHRRCGGFMLFDSLAEARQRPLPMDDGEVDYSLDRPEVVRAVLPAVDPAMILDTIRTLSASHNRYYRSATGAAASTWLRDRWRSYTSRPDVTVELVDHGYAQKSVVMTIPGSVRPDEVIVIGGHLDSISMAGGSAKAPGADDDASGIATVSEVARVLLARDVRPARTIKLMAYAAEEVGLRGSLAIARDYSRRKVKVIGALQLDMTNYRGSKKDIWLINDFTSGAQNRFLTRLIDAYVGVTWGIDACGYACSDHASWHRYGVPASMPFEARFEDMNQKIHTASDTLARSGDNADHAAKFARLAVAYAIELGDAALGDQLAAR
jgi:bacterial leucyl aminopeptidase